MMQRNQSAHTASPRGVLKRQYRASAFGLLKSVYWFLYIVLNSFSVMPMLVIVTPDVVAF